MFKYINENDGEKTRLTNVELPNVTVLFYQCKLCFVNCPYSPPHDWDVDFPRLLLREKAVRVKSEGATFQERFLGDADRAGKIGCKMAPLSNWSNKNPIFRKVMERVLGVHHKRNLPEFQNPTFEQWFQKRGPSPASNKKIALFYTCFVNYNNVQLGIAAVEVLEKNGFEVLVPKQVCCGMPFLDSGEVQKATSNMEENIKNF